MTWARITESGGPWISSRFGVGMEIIPFQPMKAPIKPRRIIIRNGRTARNLWCIRGVVTPAIVRRIPMIATPIPAPQKIKEKKCISSWYIELEVLKVYSIVPGCYLGIYSRSLGNIQNYLTIPRRFGNFPGFFGSWDSECNNHCSSC